MKEEILCKIVNAMAEEIGKLRKECDLEYGEYNEEDYKVENIIKEYTKDFE